MKKQFVSVLALTIVASAAFAGTGKPGERGGRVELDKDGRPVDAREAARRAEGVAGAVRGAERPLTAEQISLGDALSKINAAVSKDVLVKLNPETVKEIKSVSELPAVRDAKSGSGKVMSLLVEIAASKPLDAKNLTKLVSETAVAPRSRTSEGLETNPAMGGLQYVLEFVKANPDMSATNAFREGLRKYYIEVLKMSAQDADKRLNDSKEALVECNPLRG